MRRKLCLLLLPIALCACNGETVIIEQVQEMPPSVVSYTGSQKEDSVEEKEVQTEPQESEVYVNYDSALKFEKLIDEINEELAAED